MSIQINLDDELSSESDHLSHPMRIALWLRKYESMQMYKLKEIMLHNFRQVHIEEALSLYMENKV